MAHLNQMKSNCMEGLTIYWLLLILHQSDSDASMSLLLSPIGPNKPGLGLCSPIQATEIVQIQCKPMRLSWANPNLSGPEKLQQAQMCPRDLVEPNLMVWRPCKFLTCSLGYLELEMVPDVFISSLFEFSIWVQLDDHFVLKEFCLQ